MYSDWSYASLSSSDSESEPPASPPREPVHQVPCGFRTEEPAVYVVDYPLDDDSPMPDRCGQLFPGLPSTLVRYDEADPQWQRHWAGVFVGVSLFPTYYVSVPSGLYRLDGDAAHMRWQLEHVLNVY